MKQTVLRWLWALVAVSLVGTLGSTGIAHAQQEQDTDRPFIGVSFSPDGTSGVLVTQVVAGSPAEQAGLQIGDVVVTLDGLLVSGANLQDVIGGYAIGDTVELGVLRDGATISVMLTFGQRPTDDELETASEPPILETLETLEAPTLRPRLGVAIDTPVDTEGAVVTSVAQPSAAARAGVQPGDVITAVDGTPIDSPDRLVEVIAGYAPGDTVQLQVVRGGTPQAISVTLGFAPPQADAAPPATLMALPVGSLAYDAEANTWTVVDDALAENGLQPGDVITAINGETIASPEALFDVLGEAILDNGAELTVLRDGNPITVVVPVDVVTAFIATIE